MTANPTVSWFQVEGQPPRKSSIKVAPQTPVHGRESGHNAPRLHTVARLRSLDGAAIAGVAEREEADDARDQAPRASFLWLDPNLIVPLTLDG